MTSKTLYVAGAALCAALALAACKRKEEPAPAASPAATPAPTVAGASSAGAPAAPATPAPARPFDLASVPLSATAPPPFPYVDLPKTGGELSGYHVKEQKFDRMYVIAGEELRPVEGHYLERWFPLSAAKMSALEAYRNYDSAFRALGAVPVNTVHPSDPAFIARNGGDKDKLYERLHLPNSAPVANGDVPNYAQYLLRTPDKNIWLTYLVFDDGLNASVIALEEKAMAQSVKLVSAGEMAGALDKEGHIALYLNFDTDSDAIRADSKPAVDEIAKLLRSDAKLKLAVEGHTDTSGDARHNRELSQRRAQAVVRALTAQGIDAARLKAAGLGADKPVADNGSEDGRARNRRVELVKV